MRTEQSFQTAQRAASLAMEIAADDRHGYLWGGNGPTDFDCSGLVNYVYDKAGVPVNTEVRNTTRTAPIYYTRHGFADVTDKVNLATGAGLQTGDVLVNKANHMAICVGSGRIVQARTNLDNKTGDSSGQEIREQGYYNYPWDCVLRYVGDGGSAPAEPAPIQNGVEIRLPLLRLGAIGESVRALQILLVGNGFSCGGYGVDGDFGQGTLQSVRDFQYDSGIDVDGEVGKQTWSKLLGVGR